MRGQRLSRWGIPGYTYGTPALPRAAIRLGALEPVQSTMLFTDEDAHWLRVSRQVLAPHIEELLDVWYVFVGSHPHLLHYFARIWEGEPDESYLGAVRKRLGPWVLDTAAADYTRPGLTTRSKSGGALSLAASTARTAWPRSSISTTAICRR